MTAEIIDGKALAAQIKQQLKEKISRLPKAPKLAVIIVGNDPASEVYVRAKERACQETGIASETHSLSADISAEDLITLIKSFNQNPEINGILVQLPLPAHLNEKEILKAISPLKDVDGFHPLNTGLLLQKDSDVYTPCTPKGIIALIRSVKKDLTGLNAIVIGRSQIVGLPTALLLLNENCTVTIAHSKTKNLASLCQTADILVSAVGRPGFITKNFIKPGALIIDVGITRTPKGLKGDVLFDDALSAAAFITPVPGGVGPMTIAMLLENTYEAFLKQNRS